MLGPAQLAMALSSALVPAGQHPKMGFPPHCSLETVNGCAPTYTQLEEAGLLWKCPGGKKPLVPGTNGWPTCVAGAWQKGSYDCAASDLNGSLSCCCPADGCYASPRFNTVIGVCKGDGCSCGGLVSNTTTAPSCAPQGFPDACGKTPWNSPDPEKRSLNCTGERVACCHTSDVHRLVPYYAQGSKAVLNYWAAYEFDDAAQVWRAQTDASFNIDGSKPPFDLMKPYGGMAPEDAWLAPQPGGSAGWSLGYYPAGAAGVGVAGSGRGRGAALFVLSTEEWFGSTWYMLNQMELDRGPKTKMPPQQCAESGLPAGTSNNCWAAGNAGEMDFLEPGTSMGAANDEAVTSGYRASYSTQNNRMGRLFPGGVNTGGWRSRNFLLTEPSSTPEPVVYIAVVDSVGNWVYRIPAAEAEEIWPGVSRKTVAKTLQRAPNTRPLSVNPCLGEYCLVFTSNCQATDRVAAVQQGCVWRPADGWCGNWFAEMADTGQPLVPGPDCTLDERGGKQMPWCIEMVNTTMPTGN